MLFLALIFEALGVFYFYLKTPITYFTVSEDERYKTDPFDLEKYLGYDDEYYSDSDI